MEQEQKIQKKAGYHHGDLRAQLVEATRQLVEEKGPDLFSVSEACRVAGVSTAAPYRHFKDKDEMLTAVALEGLLRKFQIMSEKVAGHPRQSMDRILALGHAYLTFAQAEPGVFRLIFGAAQDECRHEKLIDEAPRHYSFVQGVVADVLGREEIDEDVKRRAMILWTFVHGLSFILINDKAAVADVEMDLDAFLREIAQRVIGDLPALAHPLA
ncbi:TetR/AcrR family transcriptional regulator [Thalassococcus sp. S3]|uniref:TetR/AcrR family transcriptional regulator n=1 Tax=Thalassococcus sp. S3 TaxID=2017482 RepID=UPI0010241AA4|nr:TetR/AcrR family transcriptional regulator [Thalassococcus sp. S3]QBF32301.1 TetR family transcriptional regulator [Thalassococcus sp. S3]